MRILFVAPRYHPNQHLWATTLIDKGHDVSFAVLHASESEDYRTLTPIVLQTKKLPRVAKIFVYAYESLSKKKHRENRYVFVPQKEIQKLIEQQQPDIIIVRDISTWLSLQTFCIARIKKIPSLIYTQQPLENRRNIVTKILQTLTIIPRVRITPVRKNSSKETSDDRRSFFVPFVAIPQTKTRRVFLEKGVLRILFVGKLGLHRKNHFIFLRAIQEIGSTIPIQATIIGGYSGKRPPLLSSIEDFIRNNNIGNSITIRENVPHQQMNDEYLKHDLFLLPSVGEPFSISVLEAMACGLPVVISNSGGAQYCVTHGESGFITAAGSLKEIVQNIKSLTSNKKLFEAMSHNALEHIRKDHSPDAFYERILLAIKCAQITR